MFKISRFFPVLIVTLILFYSLWDNKPGLFIEKKLGPYSVGVARIDSLRDLKTKIGHRTSDY
jgi:hypothetical protein